MKCVQLFVIFDIYEDSIYEATWKMSAWLVIRTEEHTQSIDIRMNIVTRIELTGYLSL